MLSNLIKHKLGSVVEARTNKVSYVRYQEDHKNSRGEKAPWVILSHESGKVLSSHKTKEEAQAHLRDMKVHAAYMPRAKEIEIMVWLRQQKNLDKQQLIDFCVEHFNIDDKDSERLIFEAMPSSLDNREAKYLEALDKSCEYSANYKTMIDDIFSIHLDNAPLYLLEDYEYKMNNGTPSTINNVCYYLLKARNLV